MARKTTFEDVRAEIESFAYELGLRYDADRQEVVGTISNDHLPQKKAHVLLSAADQEPVPRYEYKQLQKELVSLKQDFMHLCNHLGVYLEHEATNVVQLEKARADTLKRATDIGTTANHAQTPAQVSG